MHLKGSSLKEKKKIKIKDFQNLIPKPSSQNDREFETNEIPVRDG